MVSTNIVQIRYSESTSTNPWSRNHPTLCFTEQVILSNRQKKLFVKILQYSQRNIYVEMKSLLNKVAEAAYGCFRSGFRRWLFRTFSLGSCFHNHPDSVLLQKYQPLSNQGFKHNWKPFKNDEKCFLFHFEGSFRSQGI